MTRDEDGGLHVLMNRCMHRGYTICQEQRGNSSYFRCWYHGWTYTNRGELLGLPYAGVTSSMNCARRGSASSLAAISIGGVSRQTGGKSSRKKLCL